MARKLFTALILALLIPLTAQAAPQNSDDSTYLRLMLSAAKVAGDPAFPLAGNSHQLYLTVTHLQQLKAYWLQNVAVPDHYQFINDDFGAYLDNQINAVTLLADAAAQIESAQAVGYSSSAQVKANAQAELDQAKVYMAASDDSFKVFDADLHAEIDGLTDWP
jgi:hypothetical protein